MPKSGEYTTIQVKQEDADAIRANIARLQALIEIDSGKRPTQSEAVAYALQQTLKQRKGSKRGK